MKNLLIIVALGVLIAAISTLPAFATQYVLQPSPSDLWDLDHHKAYEWGIDLFLADDEVVISASLFFDDIRNWDNNSNDLYLTLINNSTAGVTVYSDNQNPSDYFAGWGTLLEHYEDQFDTTPQDVTYNFSLPELDDLNDFLENDNFGIGFDPDCHFYNHGITLTLETATIPEPSTYMLLISGLAAAVGTGIVKHRRKSL